MSTAFKAPQKSLKSSFPSNSYEKPKKGSILIKRSLSSRAAPIFRDNGKMVSVSQNFSY